jgi:hypothetical protein
MVRGPNPAGARFSAPLQAVPDTRDVKRPRSGFNHSHLSTSEVKEIEELHVYFPSVPSQLFCNAKFTSFHNTQRDEQTKNYFIPLLLPRSGYRFLSLYFCLSRFILPPPTLMLQNHSTSDGFYQTNFNFFS